MLHNKYLRAYLIHWRDIINYGVHNILARTILVFLVQHMLL